MAPLDHALAALLARAPEPDPTAGPAERRADYRKLLDVAASLVPRVEVASVEELEMDGGAGPVSARLYRPEGPGPFPTLVFFHGGGYVIGDVAGYDLQCRTLCRDVGAVVLSVEYRLAPEHPFPAAIEDGLAATRWAGLEIARLGGDPHRLAVGGDSAGGNLAAVVAQQLRADGPRLAAQLLLYPATDWATARESVERNGEGYLLTADEMAWFRSQYFPEDTDLRDPRISPGLTEDLSGLPPAVVATAEYDPLLDDGDAYAEKLRDAGVPVTHRRFDGLIHGFFGLGPLSPACAEAVQAVCADLGALLTPGDAA